MSGSATAWHISKRASYRSRKVAGNVVLQRGRGAGHRPLAHDAHGLVDGDLFGTEAAAVGARFDAGRGGRLERLCVSGIEVAGDGEGGRVGTLDQTLYQAIKTKRPPKGRPP